MSMSQKKNSVMATYNSGNVDGLTRGDLKTPVNEKGDTIIHIIFKDFNQDLVETRKASNDLNIKLELIEDKKKKNREMVTESSKADCAFMEDGWEEVEEGFEP